jgi:two-component system, NtrC family, response regulator AlgB
MRILIIDDEPNIRKSLRIALEAMNHTVEESAGVADALQRIEQARFDAAFLDLRLGRESGLDLLEALTGLAPRLAVVIITAFATIDSAVDAMRRGAFDYLAKPFTPAQIRGLIERVERLRSLHNQLADLQEQVGGDSPEVLLDSKDPQVVLVLDQAHHVAATDAVVLLRGESGTGKGVVARAIHAWSRRARGPFVTVSCPSLSAELLESTLFGHARGSFTGAVTDTEGKVGAAEAGTLFLDEVGELPLVLQPKLLRFLQEKRYERVGETRTRAADVRLIAATNRNLDSAVAAGTFRDDLLFRLNVIELAMPALRDRADRLALAEHLLTFFARHIGKKIAGLSAEARQAVLSYAWPGNLRELRNAIERAVIFASGRTIALSDLPERVGQPAASRLTTGPSSAHVGSPVTLEALEREHIKLVLERHSVLEDAARVLGIDPSTLYRKRKQLGL